MTPQYLCALTVVTALAVAMSAAAQQPPQSNSLPPGYATAPAGDQPPPASYPPPAGYSPPPSYPTAPGAYQPPAVPQPAPAYAPPPTSSQPPPRYAPPQPALEDQRVPYHVHRDARNGHDHVYPDRGSVVRELPRGALAVNYAGMSYRFYGGVWFEVHGPAFIVVAPPIGLVVQSLPAFATPVAHGDESRFYANDVYYRPRPDIGGYEVVNDPEDEPVQASAVPAASAPAQSALPIPAAIPVAPSAAVVTPAAVVAQTSVAAQAPVAGQTPAPSPPAVVPPPPATMTTSAAPAPPGGSPPRIWPTAYPKNGQSADQQAVDRYDCYQFGVAQTGYDPLRASGGVPLGQSVERRDAFERAQAACFEGRGYAVR